MNNLILTAGAPVVLILLYIYLRDKYEKEPLKLLLKTLVFGALITIPVYFIEKFLSWFGAEIFTSNSLYVFYSAFIVAGTTEEVFKFLVILILIWKNKEFNEKFDGIVYAVFASLGFALVENFLYVFSYGGSTGLVRAFTAVPAHTVFGVTMGYFFGLARFNKAGMQKLLLFVSLLLAIILHGLYDFILMLDKNNLVIVFLLVLTGMVILALKLMKDHSDNSKFNPRNN